MSLDELREYVWRRLPMRRYMVGRKVVRAAEPPGADGGLAAGVDAMKKEEVVTNLHSIMERWGFPVLVAVAIGYVMRQDMLLPLVEGHRQFLMQLSETQREIATAVQEQTRLLYALHALQPRDGAEHGE